MDDIGERVDFQNLLLLGDDLIRVLTNTKDSDTWTQYPEGAKILSSLCKADFNDITNLLEDYQEKINACRQKLDQAKSEISVDVELEDLQSKLEEELQREHLRRHDLSSTVCDKIGGLERQRICIDERKEIMKKKEKMHLRHVIVERIKEVEKFEFESTLPTLEICNMLWKMAEL